MGDIKQILTYGTNVSYDYFHMGKDAFLLSKKTLNMNKNEEKYEDVICALYQRYIRENQIDVFFVMATLDTWCTYKKEWFEGTKTVVVVVYDLIPLLFSKEYLTGKGGKQHFEQTIEFWRNADKLLAISQSVKDDFIKYLDFDPEKIEVIYSGVNERFAVRDESEKAQNDLKKKFGISKEYLLFPAAPDYRKNLMPTIDAYADLQEELRDQYQLVITGSMYAQFLREIRDLITAQNLADSVIITDYVSNEELIMLYHGAKILVFPSLYEGFGLPVVEAFISGLPVVTSNNSSLKEVAQDAAVLVDPFDKSDITAGIEKALCSTDFSAFETNIKKRVGQYTWKQTANRTLNSIKAVGCLDSETKEKERKKKKVAYFAPIDTENEMLRVCYRNVLKELCENYSVDLFVEDAEKVTNLDFYGVTAISVVEYPAYLNKYSYHVYQMANRPENMYMHEVIRQDGGVVYLHDYNLHAGAYEYFILQKQDWKSYEKLLAEEVANARDLCLKMKNDQALANKISNELALNRFVCKKARLVAVSNDLFRRNLLEKDIGFPVKKRLYYDSYRENAGQNEFSEMIPLERRTKTVALIGTICKKGGLSLVRKAVKKLEKNGISIQLLIPGMSGEEMKRLGLDNDEIELVEPSKDFHQVVAQADACIHMAHPSFIENSVAFFDLLNTAQAVITLDSKVPDEYAGKCVERVTYNDQVYHLEQKLKDVLFDETYRRRLKDGAQKITKDAYTTRELIEDGYYNKANGVVTEKLLKKVFYEELALRELVNHDEIKLLSETFGYLLEEERENVISVSENGENNEAIDVNVDSEKIMSDIYQQLKAEGIDVLKNIG